MIRVRLRRQPDRPNFTLYYDDPATGKEVSRSAGTADRGQAERAASEWERELSEFRGTEDDGWEWVTERFFRERLGKSRKSTRSNVATSLKKYREAMHPRVVGDVTTDSLSRFAARVNGEQSTAAKHLRHLKLFLRWCANVARVIKAAPYVPIPKSGKRRFMRGRALTEAEYRKMLRHADAAYGKSQAQRWRRCMELIYLSGLRIEEAVVFSWDEPPIIAQLDARPYPQILFYGTDDDGQKSGNDEAWPMPADLAAWLEKTPRNKRTGLVLELRGSTNKQIHNRVDASKAIARIGKVAGIVTNSKTGKHASAHDLRRTFGTRWALKVPPVVLQKLMRHATLETTMKYYVNLESSQIGAVLWEGKKPRRSDSGVRRRVRGKKTA